MRPSRESVLYLEHYVEICNDPHGIKKLSNRVVESIQSFRGGCAAEPVVRDYGNPDDIEKHSPCGSYFGMLWLRLLLFSKTAVMLIPASTIIHASRLSSFELYRET